MIEKRKERESSRRLRKLYQQYAEERTRLASSLIVEISSFYPEWSFDSDDHEERYVLLVMIPFRIEKRALISMLSIYGLVTNSRKGRREGDWFIEFETEEQAQSLFENWRRLVKIININSSNQIVFRFKARGDAPSIFLK